jgi:hypothetical protein
VPKAQTAFSKALQLLYAQAPGAYLYDAKLALLVPKTLRATNSVNINYPFVTFFYAIQKKS